MSFHYVVHEEEDIIEVWREVRNTGKEPVLLERINSGEFTLPGEGYRIINSNGTWADEFKWNEDTLNSGKKVYENLRGATAHVATPGFIVHQDATEQSGNVWFGVLAYSGNFKLTAEQTNYKLDSFVELLGTSANMKTIESWIQLTRAYIKVRFKIQDEEVIDEEIPEEEDEAGVTSRSELEEFMNDEPVPSSVPEDQQTEEETTEESQTYAPGEQPSFEPEPGTE